MRPCILYEAYRADLQIEIRNELDSNVRILYYCVEFPDNNTETHVLHPHTRRVLDGFVDCRILIHIQVGEIWREFTDYEVEPSQVLLVSDADKLPPEEEATTGRYGMCVPTFTPVKVQPPPPRTAIPYTLRLAYHDAHGSLVRLRNRTGATVRLELFHLSNKSIFHTVEADTEVQLEPLFHYSMHVDILVRQAFCRITTLPLQAGDAYEVLDAAAYSGPVASAAPDNVEVDVRVRWMGRDTGRQDVQITNGVDAKVCIKHPRPGGLMRTLAPNETAEFTPGPLNLYIFEGRWWRRLAPLTAQAGERFLLRTP